MPTFSTGSKRDEFGPDYALIPGFCLRRIAQIYSEGRVNYGPTNWRKGLPLESTFNHLIDHLLKWIDGDRDEDHLAKAAWGCIALMFEEDLGGVDDTGAISPFIEHFPPHFHKYLQEERDKANGDIEPVVDAPRVTIHKKSKVDNK